MRTEDQIDAGAGPFGFARLAVAAFVWAVSTKLSDGYTRLSWTLASIDVLLLFLLLLAQALKILPLGTAYAVWTGIGAIGSIVCSLLLFGETLSAVRFIGMLAIAGGC